MTDDLKTRLDAELPPGRVPFTLDTDTAVRLGRRGRTRRRLAAVGGSVLAVVAVTGLVATLLSPATEHSPDTSDKPKDAAVDDDLPELDPKFDYEWMSGMDLFEPKPNESYTKAFWEYFESEHPEAERDYKQYNIEGQPTVTPLNPGQLVTYQRELTPFDKDGGGGEPVFKDNQLGTFVDYGDVEAGSPQTFGFQFGDGIPNFIDVAVIAKGHYRVGSKDPYDLTTCVEGYSGKQFSFDCTVTDATGPNGEDVQNVTEETFRDGKLIDISYRTILYREDGSAAVLSDHVRGRFGGSDDDEGKDIEGVTPALSFDDLLGIAAALPVEPIE